jgi:electron transfer flavoprotein-quinone oxidoreductase
MRLRYDAVVIGAGPAGSSAACEIARAGLSVALLEKHEKPGQPLCCAEAVNRASFENLIKLKSEWVSAFINRAMLVGPDGNSVTAVYPNGGLVLNREKFDYDMVQEAVDSGCDLFCRTIGLNLEKSTDRFRFLDGLQPGKKKFRLEARIFIAADGVESKIGKSVGWPESKILSN